MDLKEPNFYYKLVGGTVPTLAHDSDTGYDLELIKKVRVVKLIAIGEVSLYDTGVIISPPPGYYMDMVARSSMAKTGHMLANGFGVIDPDYRGNILAAVLKYDFAAPELKLPGRYVQLIFRPVIHFTPVEVDDIDDTVRGSGGFGSTNKGNR